MFVILLAHYLADFGMTLVGNPKSHVARTAVAQRRTKPMTHDQRSLVASPEQRAAPLEMVFRRKGEMPETFVHDFTGHAEEKWITDNGARMAARAWTDPSFRTRLLADGTAVAKEMGFEFPEHHRQLVVLENATAVHNVIVCTLCSCTAYTIIGAAPDWYKDLDYRARVVRESRAVLREMGLDLPASIEIRVWDTTADHRYMVLPVQPPTTVGWSEQDLAKIVTQDSMIGASRLQAAAR
jgi:nitrile hydratase